MVRGSANEIDRPFVELYANPSRVILCLKVWEGHSLLVHINIFVCFLFVLFLFVCICFCLFVCFLFFCLFVVVFFGGVHTALSSANDFQTNLLFPIDGTQTGTTSSAQNAPGNYSNERVFHTPEISRTLCYLYYIAGDVFLLLVLRCAFIC